MPRKIALIVGIDEYAFMEEKYQLAGCANDAGVIRGLLTDKFGFPSDNITMLLNGEARRDSILAAMETIVTGIGKEDIVVFHYSGHGHRCRVKSEFTDEASGKQNCILPHDDSEPGPDGDIYREIRDHQINDWLMRLSQHTSNITLIFDACHSGTVTRSSDRSSTTRCVPEMERPAAGDPRAADQKNSSGNWLQLSDHYVVISGCRDVETSKEKYFDCDGETIKHGVLSWYLTRALMDAGPDSTYRDIYERACSGVLAEVSEQHPQIEGNLDRELFGARDIEPLRFLPVLDSDDENTVIGGGAALGVQRASLWDVYPQGTKKTTDCEPLARLEVTALRGLTSDAKLVGRGSTPPPGSRCVAASTSSPTPLRVFLDAPASHSMEYEQTLASSPLLRLTTDNRAYDLRCVLKPQESATGIWRIVNTDNRLLAPPHAANKSSALADTLSNLEAIARYRNILQLENPTSELDVSFNLYWRGSNDELETANDGNRVFSEQDALVLEIINNEPERTVFFSVLWLSATCSVGTFYPHKRACEALSPGNTVRIGDGKRRITAYLGDDYRGEIGMECCKTFFSSSPADYSVLSQSGTRSSESSFKRLAGFETACMGRSGDESQQATIADTQDWRSINRSFLLRRGK